MVGFVTNDGAVRPLSDGFLPDCLEQRAIHDRGLLARQDLILVFDLAVSSLARLPTAWVASARY
jgi:hypothetical protein